MENSNKLILKISRISLTNWCSLLHRGFLSMLLHLPPPHKRTLYNSNVELLSTAFSECRRDVLTLVDTPASKLSISANAWSNEVSCRKSRLTNGSLCQGNNSGDLSVSSHVCTSLDTTCLVLHFRQKIDRLTSVVRHLNRKRHSKTSIWSPTKQGKGWESEHFTIFIFQSDAYCVILFFAKNYVTGTQTSMIDMQ